MTKLASAWAKKEIEGAQAAQKRQYDHAAKDPKLRCGDRVMVYMPSEVQGNDRKLARPYHSPYRVVNVMPTNAEVVLVDQVFRRFDVRLVWTVIPSAHAMGACSGQ